MPDEIAQKIIYYSQKYYDGNSEISDAEFDKLVNNLRTANPNHPLLKTIGWGYKVSGEEKITHKTLVGSLSKVRITEVTPEILAKYPVATPKIDGGSACAYYENGYLSKIVSRGDGTIGMDITSNMRHAVPIYLGFDWTGAVRGEITLTLEDFEKIGGSSPRNRAVGLSQQKYPDNNSNKLKLITYSIVWQTDLALMRKKTTQLTVLSDLGFTILHSSNPKTKDELINGYASLARLLTGEHLPTDGIVLSSELPEIKEENGGYSIVNPSIAVKFEEEEAITSIKDIEWTVNRTGRVVPVGIIEPVFLSGASISRVTCYNYAFVRDQELGKGAKVRLVRANEIIPKIIETIEPAEITKWPNICPICNTDLEFTSSVTDIICPNINCPAKLTESLIRLFELTKPDGIGDTTLDSLVTCINDIFPPSFEEEFENLASFLRTYKYSSNKMSLPIFDNYGPHLSELIIKMFDDILIFSPKISDLVYIANIPMVGNKAGEELNKIPAETFIKMLSIKYFDPIRSFFRASISFDNFITYSDRLNSILEIFNNRIANSSNFAIKTEKIKVAVTGKLSMSREQFYKNHPNIIESDVTKDTKYLVTNEASNSSKYQNAKKLGIAIVSEEEFEKI